MSLSFLSQILSGGTWLWEDRTELAAAAVLVCTSAAALVKALQAFVDMFEKIWPGISKTDTLFGRALAGIAWVSHLKILNLAALTPTPEHAAATWSRPAPTAKDRLMSGVVSKDDSKGFVAMSLLIAILLGLACLTARPARAQVVSAGLSLPMLEFQSGNPHPVQFAPGAGGMLSVGFFQMKLLGQEWDLLDVSGTVFGSALSAPNGATAGALQAGLLLGSFNDVIAIGAAVPLYGPAGIGAFQGVFQVYPLLVLNLPIAIETGPSSSAAGAQGAAAPQRGGTLYFGGR